MGNLYNRAVCNLMPHSHIKWNVGDPITRVFIFSSPSHPKNDQEVWCCLHHGSVSLDHVQLQVRKMHIVCRVVGSRSEKGVEKEGEKNVEGGKVEEESVSI